MFNSNKDRLMAIQSVPIPSQTGSQFRGPINSHERPPWGWHFRPTDPELINSLRKKVKRPKHEREFEPSDYSEVLREIDLSKVEPWEIKGVAETCPIRAAHADEVDQYFYTQKEQKYRHGKRSNRATKQGFWKATGRDKPIYGRLAPRDAQKRVIGYRKALVFYRGRAPSGSKTDWILHEYRLEKGADASARDEQWVACHMFIKERLPTKDPPEASGSSVTEMQEQHSEQTSKQYLQQSRSMKEEPGYGQSYQQGGSLFVLDSVCPPDSAFTSQHAPTRRDDLSLPRLEEFTYAGPETASSVRPTTGRQQSFNDVFDPVMGKLPSFNNELLGPAPSRLPSFDNDLIFGNNYVEQQPQNQYGLYQADDILWGS